MPIIVEALKAANFQDQQDLQKIYRDAPQRLCSPFSGEFELIENGLADGSFVAGPSMNACSVQLVCKGTKAFGTCPIYAYEKLPGVVAAPNDG